ncbi:MarR family winged helix-turn-helix transcriptional regulator [Cellulosimicrobium arenosum]|uniref:Winged helix DNA-binding protein n=1 Tax=Cellulosimicrobium arenosum TaxID=2708133 RepID=A0A927G8U2_9MICO|nr:MarR family transcriptional regulator [Cellulosimicrobium arenosum]MBD8078679.1 winged helix DNA-binding protein [Cellulosimicrobium arenosum]
MDGTTSPAGPLDHLPSWLLSRAAARSHRVLQRHLRAAGSTGYEYRVVAALAAHGVQSQADVGRAVALDRRDVTHTVRALEERGLVQRAQDATDARLVRVGLTPAGRQEWTRLEQVMQDVQDELLAPLDPAEARVLTELVGRLDDCVSP